MSISSDDIRRMARELREIAEANIVRIRAEEEAAQRAYDEMEYRIRTPWYRRLTREQRRLARAAVKRRG